MIFISTSCLRNNRIGDSIEELAYHGFKNIELSGGTSYYEEFETDLLRLKKEYNLNYLVHNYFPPPSDGDFAINLASFDDNIYARSIQQLNKSILLSRSLGANKYSFHAGFFIDINVDELGKKISRRDPFVRDAALERFCAGFLEIEKKAKGLELYLENNVYSQSNYNMYKNNAPLMLLHYNDYMELKQRLNFKLLLDIGHLNVTARTLNLKKDDEFKKMFDSSDYIHISENDGFHDQNLGLKRNGYVVEYVRKQKLYQKIFTLEIVGNINTLKDSYNILSEITKGT
jgi:sugar phosphate isomerase/epimerase